MHLYIIHISIREYVNTFLTILLVTDVIGRHILFIGMIIGISKTNCPTFYKKEKNTSTSFAASIIK